jgi:hypothetical protein
MRENVALRATDGVMERLRKCTSFAELRIAMRVEVHGCQVCGASHGGSLVERASRRVPLSETVVDWTICWIVAPSPRCAKEVGKVWGRQPEWVVTPVTVEQGRVYIVEEFDEQSTTRSRKLEEVE